MSNADDDSFTPYVCDTDAAPAEQYKQKLNRSFLNCLELINSTICDGKHITVRDTDFITRDDQKPKITIPEPIESSMSLSLLTLYSETIRVALELSFIKTMDPHVLLRPENDILNKLKITALTSQHYAQITSSLFRQGFSTDLTTYSLSIRLKGLFEESMFMIECLAELTDVKEYFRKVFRVDSCDFWHSGKIMYLNQCADILFTLDFVFNIIPTNKIVSTLNDVEDFVKKIYGAQCSIHPFVVDFSKPCRECIIVQRNKYDCKSDFFAYGSCPHMYRTVNFDNEILKQEYMVDVGDTSPFREGIGTTAQDIINITDTKDNIEKFYEKLLSKHNEITGTDDIATDMEKNIQKAIQIRKHILHNKNKLGYKRGWKDALDVFSNETNTGNDLATIIYTVPLMFLSSKELIEIRISHMEHNLQRLKQIKKETITQQVANIPLCEEPGSQEDIILKKLEEMFSSNFTTFQRDKNKQDSGSVGDVDRLIRAFKTNLKLAPQVAKDELLKKMEINIDHNVKITTEKIAACKQELLRVAQPSVPETDIMKTLHHLHRCLAAKKYFLTAIKSMTRVQINTNGRNITQFASLDTEISTATLSQLTETMKTFLLGPVHRTRPSDNYFPIRKGFIFYTVCEAMEISACSKLQLSQILSLEDFKHNMEKNSDFTLYNCLKEAQQECNRNLSSFSDDVNHMFMCSVKRIRFIVMALCAFNVLYTNSEGSNLQLLPIEDDSNIVMGMNSREIFNLREALYIGSIFTPLYLVYKNKQNIKTVCESMNIIDLLCHLIENGL